MRSPTVEAPPTGPTSDSTPPTIQPWAEIVAKIDRLNRSDPLLALETAAEWLAQEQAGDDSERIARAFRSHASALVFNRRYDEAIEHYEEAEARFEALGRPADAARAQLGHVTALRYKGRYQKTVDLGLRSIAVLLEHGDDLQAARQAQNLGTVYRPMGRLHDAVRAYRDALAVLRRLNERSAMRAIREQYDHPYFWAPFVVIGDGLTSGARP